MLRRGSRSGRRRSFERIVRTLLFTWLRKCRISVLKVNADTLRTYSEYSDARQPDRRRFLPALRTGVTVKTGKDYDAIDPELIETTESERLSFNSFWSDIYQTDLSFGRNAGILPAVHSTRKGVSDAANDLLTLTHRIVDIDIGQAEDDEVIGIDMIDWSA